MPRIFISYSRKDEAFGRRLATSLSQMGADVWIDLEDIPVGMKWSSAIQEGLDTANILIVIISPDSMASRNVEDEWQYYLDNRKPVIPILLRPAKIHFQLSRIQYIDFQRQEYDLALRQLYAELSRKGVHLTPTMPMPSPATAYLPTPHQYPQPTAPRPRQNVRSLWPIAVGMFIALVGIMCALAVVILPNLRPVSTPTNNGTVAAASTTAPTNPPAAQPTDPPLNTPIPLGWPGNPVLSNASWSPVTQAFNGIDMVLVPVGCFTMGSTQAQVDNALNQQEQEIGQRNPALAQDETPTTPFCIDKPFWIDRTEVSNQQFGSYGVFPGENDPRANVTWYEAELHCEAWGGRLPTEAEWEYAARGPDNLLYPWGNQLDGSRMNYCDTNCEFSWRDTASNDGFAKAAPVGSYPSGASWVGALDMAGNVWEWTSSIYRFPYPYRADDGRENLGDINAKRTLRGGSWNWIASETRTTARDDYAEGQQPYPSSDWYSFRCARDYQSGDY